MDWERTFTAGLALTAEQAARAAARLRDDPDDLATRIELMGYHFLYHRDDRGPGHEHIVWWITHHPELDLHAHVDHNSFPEVYEECRRLWLEVLAQRPEDTRVLKSAATFVHSDDPLRLELLRRGEQLTPDDPHWRRTIRHDRRHRAEAWDATDEERLACGREAIADYETELAAAKHLTQRIWYEMRLAEAALWAADLPLATRYAETLRARADEVAGTWVHGDVIHWANIFLGRIALAHDDVPRALAHLAAAGATPGSKQLRRTGPDQQLGYALVQRGQHEAVIAYVDACRQFWSGGLPQLAPAYRHQPTQLRVV